MKMQALKTLISQLNSALNDTGDMGFGPAPTPTVVYVSRRQGGVWYTWDHDASKAESIAAESLTGRVTDVYAKDKDTSQGVSTKLRVAIDAGQKYSLEMGVSTTVARQLLLHLCNADPSKPLTIAPYAGDEESVLFARVYQDGARLDADLQDDRSGQELLVQLCDAWDMEYEHYELVDHTQPSQLQRQSAPKQGISPMVQSVLTQIRNGDPKQVLDNTDAIYRKIAGSSESDKRAVQQVLDKIEAEHRDPEPDSFEPDDDLPF